MKTDRILKYMRPLLFLLVLALHVAAICAFNFKQKDAAVESVELREAEVFKLVDIQEYEKSEVKTVETKKNVVKVSSLPKASEKIVETKEEVQVEKNAGSGSEEFLPQHKISAVPVIPSEEVLSRIVYPPLALKQGIEAVVYLELFIDANGSIRKIRVLKDPGHGFAEAAVAALKGISCIPANANGKACAVKYRFPVKFTLN